MKLADAVFGEKHGMNNALVNRSYFQVWKQNDGNKQWRGNKTRSQKAEEVFAKRKQKGQRGSIFMSFGGGYIVSYDSPF